MPNSAYRIPADTKYILFSTQKNYFSFDIISDDLKLPFPFKDPIKHKISGMLGLYDRPPKTPCIEDEVDNENMPTNSNIPENSNMPTDNNMPHNSNMPSNNNDKLSEINLYFVPNPPILERNITLATPDFVKTDKK